MNVLTLQVFVPHDANKEEVIDLLKKGLPVVLAQSLGVTASVLDQPHHVELENVREFHNKFMVPMAETPHILDRDAQTFRRNFLKEELREFDEGYAVKDISMMGDALVDLVYIAVGTALMMGLPWAEMWANVQERNMAKELAKPDGSNSKRNSPLDVIKPRGWYPPDHWKALGMSPEDQAPIFHATNAVLALAERRRQTVSDVKVKEADPTTPSPSE